MKLLLTALLCLLLAGCSEPETGTPPVETEMVSQVVWEPLSAQYPDTVEAVLLPFAQIQQLWPVADGYLLQSGQSLVLLDAVFQQTAAVTLEFVPEITVNGSVIGAFDRETDTLLLLDHTLQETRRLTLPSGLSGAPAVSADGMSISYSTGSGLYRWDLESGIRRRIRETGCPLELLGLFWNDKILHCRVWEEEQARDLFIDDQTGQLLQELPAARFFTQEDRYYCVFSSGTVKNLVFGTDQDGPMALFPQALSAQCQFLPKSHGAVTVEEGAEDTQNLTYYALDTGFCWDSLTLSHTPKQILDGGNHTLLLLITEQEQDLLLIWKPREASGGTRYVGTYFTADTPDHAGLSLCRDYAQTLSQTYGLEILLWKEAAAIAPWDYRFTPEHRYPVLISQLQTLERCLNRYPAELLTQTAAHFDCLRICLVQSITGSAGDSSLSSATGIQFLHGSDAHVVLAAGPYQEQALYHELFHVMETHILSHSSALDRWNELNPAGFSYDLDHAANAKRNSGVYLENGTRAFVDTYSMSFPTEDRARVFEYAMLPDSGHLFRSEIMQNKLQAICTGIREAYGLGKSPDIFPWEQYLQ